MTTDNIKEQKIDQLVEWVVGLMDIDDLEAYVRDDLKEYYEGIEDIEEFNDDLRKIKYIKRLFNQYASEGVLKERLLLNHIIIFYNVFPPKAATKILFYKIEERFWPILKTFLFYLNLLPENEIGTIMGKKIKSKEIDFDQGVVNTLRKFDKEG